MYQPSLQYSLVSNAVVDGKLLRWTDRTVANHTLALPYVANVLGELFSISDFNQNTSTVISLNLPSISIALERSLELYGIDSITLQEWKGVYGVLSQNGIDKSFVRKPSGCNLNIEEFCVVISSLDRYTDDMLLYLSTKKIPWRLLYLLTLMPAHHLKYIGDYVDQKSPSVQSFKLFVESVRDFSDRFTPDMLQYSDEEHLRITNRLSPLHTELLGMVSSIKSGVPSVQVSNVDQFESSTLQWSFTVKSYEEYVKIVNVLQAVQDDVKKLYLTIDKI